MSNEYFSRTNPLGDFGLVQQAFDKLPVLAGNANEVVVVNSGATALTSMTELTFNAGIYANLSGYLKGCIPSNNGSDATNDIDFSAGFAFDGTRGYTIGAKTKRADAGFSTGTGNGGMASVAGTPITFSATTDYHWFLLLNPATGVSDFGCDTSVTAANLLTTAAVTAAGFTVALRDTSLRTAGSAAWPTFAARELSIGQVEYLLKAPVFQFSKSWSGADNNAQTGTLANAPGGIKVIAIMGWQFYDATPSAGSCLLISSFDQDDTTPDTPVGSTVCTFRIAATDGVIDGNSSGQVRVRTSTSRTIRYRTAGSTADHQAGACLDGWVDSRI